MGGSRQGLFEREGLDYELHDQLASPTGRMHDLGDRVGAYQTFERGHASDISCACHRTVNAAASVGHGKLYPHASPVAPTAVFVPPESKINHPAELAGVPISVGYQSGSRYATIQVLEQYLPRDDISLSFADGLLFRRTELLIDRQVPAASVFSGPYCFLEQLGFRKIIDSTFMMASMINGNLNPRLVNSETCISSNSIWQPLLGFRSGAVGHHARYSRPLPRYAAAKKLTGGTDRAGCAQKENSNERRHLHQRPQACSGAAHRRPRATSYFRAWSPLAPRLRGARRYRTSADNPKYVALYHLASPEVIDKPEWKEAERVHPDTPACS